MACFVFIHLLQYGASSRAQLCRLLIDRALCIGFGLLFATLFAETRGALLTSSKALASPGPRVERGAETLGQMRDVPRFLLLPC